MAAKKKTGKPYGNKTKLVLSLPREMPAKEVVQKAKQQGVVLSEAHVYKIRSTNKPTGGAGKAAQKPAAAPTGKATAVNVTPGMSKRDFVLSFPPDTSASEILRKAKETGIGLSKAYLYTVRNAAGGQSPRAAARANGHTRAAGGARGSSSLEAQFVDAALDLGLARAAELLDQVRTRLKAGL